MCKMEAMIFFQKMFHSFFFICVKRFAKHIDIYTFGGLFKISRYRKTLPALSIGWAQFFFFQKTGTKIEIGEILGKEKNYISLLKNDSLLGRTLRYNLQQHI